MEGQNLHKPPDIAVIIPAFNEAESIGRVLEDIPENLVSAVLVVDNDSTDDTSKVARNFGATVLHEHSRGYGFACAKGINYLKSNTQRPDILVFMDADYADFPQEITRLVEPILEQDFDLVIGSRTKGSIETRAMPLQQVIGNWLAVRIIRLFYRYSFSDLGPFRAIKFKSLEHLEIKNLTYGWPTEMQLKAVRQNLRIAEVPVSYRKRIGRSKISGTIRGTILSGYNIITTIFRCL